MKKSLIISTVLFLFISGLATAQDLHIYYDKQGDIIRYESNGKTIKHPKVKKGANVYLHIENYNNYLYNANVRVDNIAINPPNSTAGNPLMGLMPGGGSGGQGFNLLDIGISKLKKGVIDLLDGNSGSSGGDILGFGGTDEEEIMGFAQIKDEFNETLQEIETIEIEFEKIGEEVQKELESKKIRDIALEELNNIKYNPELTPSQIKKLSKEYFNKVFKEKPVEEINLDEVLAMGNTPAQMSKNLEQLKINSIQYDRAESTLKNLEDQTGEMLGFANVEFTEFQDQLDETYGFIKTVKDAVKKDMVVLKEMANDDSNIDLRRITALRNEYEVLEENEFSKTFRVQATEDIVNFNLSFSAKDSMNHYVRRSSVSDINVPVAGGFKVHPSLGVSFGQFFEQPEEYNVKDGVIVSSETGTFVPVITSFLHFYGQRAKGASYGGSFGIGFPVASSGTDQSIFFLIGPSLILGKESKIVVSAGIMGGKVKRLGAGYELGDSFMNNAAILPTVSKYETGYFLGMSYNIGN